ncbi:MAG: response regulator transcription factor [Lachnospiraceae bacterium]|nr:response regulator transcription factor [Lachnospiraceae bacterium]
MANILVCDDDKDIVAAIEIYLQEDGHSIYKAYNGREALDILSKEEIQLVILDIMMPEMDGIETAEEIRKTSTVPIIFLSAKSEEEDKILGLNAGGDDYVTKPFSPAELTARVRSNLRRYTMLGSINEGASNNHIYNAGSLCINDETKVVTVDGEPVKLTPIEYNILLLLIKNKGTVFSTDKIYESIWNETPIATDNTVAVHIRHIREKIEINPGQPKFLKVVWGVGYKIEDL